jgi:hypothetical protein
LIDCPKFPGDKHIFYSNRKLNYCIPQNNPIGVSILSHLVSTDPEQFVWNLPSIKANFDFINVIPEGECSIITSGDVQDMLALMTSKKACTDDWEFQADTDKLDIFSFLEQTLITCTILKLFLHETTLIKLTGKYETPGMDW